MADSQYPFGKIVSGQGSQEVKANQLFDAVSPAALYGLRGAATTGLVLGFYGGKLLISGVLTTIADGTIALTASSTNYVEAHPDTGVVSKNTTAFTPGYLPIAAVTTNTTSIVPTTGFVDCRVMALASNATLALAMSDAIAARIDDPDHGVEPDIQFHIAIATATHNPYYLQLLQYMNLQLHQAVRTARVHSSRQPGLPARVHAEHVAIFDAIRARDADLARQRATEHLRNAAGRLGLPLRQS